MNDISAQKNYDDAKKAEDAAAEKVKKTKDAAVSARYASDKAEAFLVIAEVELKEAEAASSVAYRSANPVM